ncbi:MAG: hypothetical protein WC127_02290 [Acidaminococcaceae bacterium]
MKKIFMLLLLFLTMCLAGCAKGVITLDISRMGTADIDCKLVTVPMLTKGLDSFQSDFIEDGYTVNAVNDGEMKGFLAHKHYARISDVKDSKVLEAFRFEKLQKVLDSGKAKDAPAATKNSTVVKPMLVVDKGLLFDTVTVNTHLNLKANPEKISKHNEQWIMENLIKQIDLRFVLKLPTRVTKTNASMVSEDGRTMTWVLSIGDDNPMQATVTYCNPFKAVGWLLGILLLGGGAYVLWRRHNHLRGRNNEH